MIKVDILFQNKLYYFAPSLFLFLLLCVYIKTKQTYSQYFLPSKYFKIDKYPKPCVFSLVKKGKLLVHEFIFFDSVRIQFCIAQQQLTNYFHKTSKISPKLRQMHLGYRDIKMYRTKCWLQANLNLVSESLSIVNNGCLKMRRQSLSSTALMNWPRI